MYPVAHAEQDEPEKPVEHVQEQEPAFPETLDAWLLQCVATLQGAAVVVTVGAAVVVIGTQDG